MKAIKFVFLVFFIVYGLSQDAFAEPTCPESGYLCPSVEDAAKERTPLTSPNFERVVDGDTFVASGRKVRVWGIDAPEKGETGYMTAGWFLDSFIKGKELNCKFIDKDKYQRDVMQCFSDGMDIGSIMVRFGLARDYKKYSGGYYEQEEREAKRLKRGIWSIGQ